MGASIPAAAIGRRSLPGTAIISAFQQDAAGCCLGRGLVEASTSFGVARLYSTLPRAWPPWTVQEHPFPTHDVWESKQVFTGVAQ
jgi:hypothetical protein